MDLWLERQIYIAWKVYERRSLPFRRARSYQKALYRLEARLDPIR